MGDDIYTLIVLPEIISLECCVTLTSINSTISLLSIEVCG
jgi:hypothetical protein